MIKVDAREITALARQLERASKNVARDFNRALIDTQRRTRTAATASSLAQYAVKRNRIASEWHVTPPDQRTLSFELTGRKRPIGLLNFNARATRTGLVVEVKKGKTERLRHAFVAKSPAGGQLAWNRKGPARRAKAGRYAGQLRQPIVPLFGPSMADMLNNPDVMKPLEKAFFDRAGQILTKAIQKALNGN